MAGETTAPGVSPSPQSSTPPAAPNPKPNAALDSLINSPHNAGLASLVVSLEERTRQRVSANGPTPGPQLLDGLFVLGGADASTAMLPASTKAQNGKPVPAVPRLPVLEDASRDTKNSRPNASGPSIGIDIGPEEPDEPVQAAKGKKRPGKLAAGCGTCCSSVASGCNGRFGWLHGFMKMLQVGKCCHRVACHALRQSLSLPRPAQDLGSITRLYPWIIVPPLICFGLLCGLGIWCVAQGCICLG
jgi:hypothetical protein